MARVHLIYFDLHTGYYPSFHHGLAYIISTLRNERHDVSLSHIADENDFDKEIKFLEREKFDSIGLSFTTNQKKYVCSFLKKIKPQVRLTIAGGVHCTLAKDKVFDDLPEIDGICIGEGEMSLKELYRRLDNNEDYFATPSFYFKTENRVIKNPIAHLQDIDSLPYPDYSLFDYNKIILDSSQCFPMMLSRGCPYNCNYCCNHAFRQIYPNKDKYVRFPSIGHSINIIKNNLSLYPKTRKILFSDDTFTFNKKWLFDFCKLYRKEISLPFLCNARVETIDDETVKCLKNSGCISIDFGVESGNEWLRADVLNRRHSNEKIKEAFNITKKYGIKRFSFNMVGLPFETKEMVRDTLNLNLELQPNFGKCFYFYPYPGTKLYQLCLEYNLLLDDIESVSGYLESPSLKEVYMPHKEMRKYFELIQVFFYARLLFSKIKLSPLLEKSLLKMIFLLRRSILFFLDPIKKKGGVIKLRQIMRKLALKYLR